jgi:competence transcription factor ComK
MARWVKLTSTGDEKPPIYVNVDNVTYLFPDHSGTRIWFAGHDEANVVVEERPEEIVAMRTL